MDRFKSDAPVVGRESEVAALSVLLDEAAQGPTGLLLCGEPGIGKTTIWREGVQRATQRDMTVLVSRPTESETRLPYAALADLLDPVPTASIDALPGPPRRALEIALLRADPGDEGLQQRAIGVAVLALLGDLTRDGPVMVAIDDAQWLDRPSAHVLEFALRRLTTQPIGVLVTERSGQRPGDILGLGRSLPGGNLTTIELQRLATPHLELLLRERLAVSLPASTVRRIDEVSAGNPFFALEIGRALLRQGVGSSVGSRVGLGMPVPETLRELVLERLYRLPGPSRDALRVIAALSRPTIALVRAALGEAVDVDRALARAEERGVVETDGAVVRFSHPLLGSVLYAELSPDARRGLHRQLAAIVDDEDERAQHLALAATVPDEDVADALERAALRVRRRGAPDAAAALADAARRLTPPADPTAVLRRTLTAADDYLDAGVGVRAAALLEPLADSVAPGQAQARVLLSLARVRMFDRGLKAAQPLLERAAVAAGDDALLQAAIGRDLLTAVTQSGDLRQAEAGARETLAWAERADEPMLVADALVQLSLVEFLLGRGIRDDLLGRAAALEPNGGQHLWGGPASFVPSDLVWGALLKWSDRFDEARSRFDAVRRWAAATGTENLWTSILFQAGELELWSGDVEAAQRAAEEARSAADRGVPEMQHEYAYLLAAVQAQLGDIDDARGALATAKNQAERTDDMRLRIRCEALDGFIELSLGRPNGAITSLERAMDLFRSAGYGDPGVVRFVPDLVEALLAGGDGDRAANLQRWLDERGATLGRPYALATGARCRALILAASGDLAGALAAVGDAIEHHQRFPQPFEHARSLLVQGGLLRRSKAKREARVALTAALAIFDRLGTRLWAERCESELGRISGRGPAIRGLTPTEARVAQLAAQGYRNQEIAERLFVSAKTIETHLTRVYDKLGVKSRGELVRRSRTGEIPDFASEPRP